ncbi:MAG: rhomboid family intramembrane serine protease [Flavobacteriales bacterium]|nr:rhomboid family intramembrane serine protease [Flavobacteriales bacterium]
MLRKPWTVVSSLFTQLDPGHLFWNMALFWVLGRMYGDLLGGKRLLGTYILGGLCGGIYSCFSHNLFPGGLRGAAPIGASSVP